jgi:peptidoglycan/LPS O-acetylase OafA/YrhL
VGVDQKRINYLDGLRGVAIIWVVFYHYCGPTYASIVRYDAGFLAPVVSRGWTGVQLFFLISGYVILMTLDKCRSFPQFMRNRWIRLFPAMLIATVVVCAFNAATDLPGPHVSNSWIDVVPGLIFVPPSFIHAITHLEVDSLDGVFWTLYTEMGFYVVFGLTYFKFGWRYATGLMIILAIVTSLAGPALDAVQAPHVLQRVVEPLSWMNMHVYGWFACGAMFWKAREYHSSALFYGAVSVGVANAIFQINYVPFGWLDRVVLLAVVLLFSSAQAYRPLQVVLSARSATFFGAVSYPLYLLHNEIGVSVVGWANSGGLNVGPAAVVGLTFAGATAGAWVVARYVEPRVRSAIFTALNSARLSVRGPSIAARKG